jgi:hypothetical protein
LDGIKGGIYDIGDMAAPAYSPLRAGALRRLN